MTWLETLHVIALMIFVLVVGLSESKMREDIRQIKIDVALLQQQVIVLLVGQGYALQEKRPQ